MNAATAPSFTSPRFVVAHLLRGLCRHEQTEAHLFDALRDYDKEIIDGVIDEMLDAGELHPSMVQHDGRTYPTLTSI